jgi:hypothetical protein
MAEYYGKTLRKIGAFVGTALAGKEYPRDVSKAKNGTQSEPIATTTSAGVTVVNTDGLLLRQSVIDAIKILSDKAEAATGKK